jgi:class 3 adenylate cyclase
MAEKRAERRLVAIFAADMVGYSRLMEADEKATVRTLNTCRQVIDELVAELPLVRAPMGASR